MTYIPAPRAPSKPPAVSIPEAQKAPQEVSPPPQKNPAQPPQRPPEMQFANKMLGHLNLSDIDSGDLLLLSLLFFLFRQKADEELLIALGLLLIL